MYSRARQLEPEPHSSTWQLVPTLMSSTWQSLPLSEPPQSQIGLCKSKDCQDPELCQKGQKLASTLNCQGPPPKSGAFSPASRLPGVITRQRQYPARAALMATQDGRPQLLVPLV